jgi:hypothetical protein
MPCATAKHWEINGHLLTLTCPSDPEQYDVEYCETTESAAYIRIRNNFITVEVPDVRGFLVYSSFVYGYGALEDYERERHLNAAVEAIISYKGG